MIRRLEVIYEEEGLAPVVTLEGVWNRRLIDQLPTTLMKALRAYKLQQVKTDALANEIMEEKKHGKRK